MCKSVWIGVDLGKARFAVAWASGQGDALPWPALPHREFHNTPQGFASFLTWLDRQSIKREVIAGVCLESSGRLAWRFAERAGNSLGPISIVNPAWPSAFGKSLGIRDKTDRIDACILALYGVATTPRAKALPTSEQHQLRELSDLCRRLKTQRDAYKNQQGNKPESPRVRQFIAKEIKRLNKEIVKMEKHHDALIAQDTQLNDDYIRMQTIPGVGPVTARTVITEFGDLRQYKRNEITALAGLYPKQFRSGTSVHKKPHLAKCGGRRVRNVLYMAALNARRFCPQLKQFADRLKANGLSNMAILGAIMRKLLLLIRTLIVHDQNYTPLEANTLYSSTT